MKTSLFILMLFFQISFAQGKFADEFKNILGMKYTTEYEIPQLKGFVYQQGIMLSDVGASYIVTLNVFKKGKISLVILEKLIDLENKKHAIIEVLKLGDVPRNYEIRISNCTSKYANPDDKIVAVYYIGTNKKVKLIKEAFVLKDIRFEKLVTKNIICTDEI